MGGHRAKGHQLVLSLSVGNATAFSSQLCEPTLLKLPGAKGIHRRVEGRTSPYSMACCHSAGTPIFPAVIRSVIFRVASPPPATQ